MDLADLKKIWMENGFRPNKRLGQNFLVDNNVRDNILRYIGFKPEDTVVEIGAGFGVMTFAIARKCARLYAVEKDSRVCAIMSPLFKTMENIELIHADFLTVDLAGLSAGRDLAVYGNIPYYISSPIIETLIEQRRIIKRAYLVMQEELADRIVSPPGTKAYGSLSCFVQYFTKPGKVFRIRKNCFYPKPQVDSCLLEIIMLESPSVAVKNEELMFRIIRKGFSQRRKKVINPLSQDGSLSMDRAKWREVFCECGLDPSKRAEDLSLSDYAKLADTAESML
ncbi:MAG: 16S rRNA (adenine(1518)-N(6)/adenine(1519)-N(6))-dimethyltransferase RsmA [Candidatus Omnitrophota bacterium]